MTEWTQEEAIAFECARECITDMMAIYSGRIADESQKERPNGARLVTLRADRSKLAQERAALRVHDHANIARIRAEYGALIRAHRSI